jgi:hypothetical protein
VIAAFAGAAFLTAAGLAGSAAAKTWTRWVSRRLCPDDPERP